MELKVWVEGIQRIVCGVTETTTCQVMIGIDFPCFQLIDLVRCCCCCLLRQDVVFALAHATGKVGRFTLIEKWRNNERLLAPNENPLKVYFVSICLVWRL